MSGTELKKHKRSDLDEKEILGSGNFGCVKLLYDKERKQRVVGKLFLSGGVQSYITKQLAEAEREAKILARLTHRNIVKVLGFMLWDEHSFMIIMEYAPCKDLENLLMSDQHIPLPWKLRARFFTELASALDYLHNHDPKRSYIHGDLKPQNVLLGDALEIKLGDFGAATIAKLTGATSTTISGGVNKQHTPLYAAPEYLSKPTVERNCKMDIYSYGMIGYEILTRQVVYSGCKPSTNLVLSLIMQTGLKPNEECLDDVANDIAENTNDLIMFQKLQEVVKQCWQFNPKDRPTISDVKKILDQLARSEKIYEDAVDFEANLFIQKRKLKSVQQQNDESSNNYNIARLKKWMLGLLLLVFTLGYIAVICLVAFRVIIII